MGQAHPQNTWPPLAQGTAETRWEQAGPTAQESCSQEGQTESEQWGQDPLHKPATLNSKARSRLWGLWNSSA